MMRSLYSAISGLKNHQVKMDVIGNNIANVNTTGFKRSRVTFSTALSQTLRGASAPTPNPPVIGTPSTAGGTNAIQVGLGVMLGSIDQIMTPGSSQSTGKATDMMLAGPGFFVLQNSATGTVYSRAGNFGLDSAGNLCDPGTGALVQGVMATDETTPPAIYTTPGTPPTQPTLVPIQIVLGSGLYNTAPTVGGPALDSYSIDQKGLITGVYITPATVGPPATASVSQTARIGQIAVAGFPNDAGLQNIGNNFYRETSNSGTVSVGEAGSPGLGAITPSTIEMSNVDLSTEFTDMIVTQRGFQANSRVITVSDSLLQELIDLKRQ